MVKHFTDQEEGDKCLGGIYNHIALHGSVVLPMKV
jgi:hypothetical protein